MEKIRIAIIGGSGLEKLFEKPRSRSIKTPYGSALGVSTGRVGGKRVAFLPRHGPQHQIPPHRINYRANIFALHKLGVRKVFATNAVGAINRDLKPAELVVPHDFIDFTKCRVTTFYERRPVTHIGLSQPFCPEIRRSLISTAGKIGLPLCSRAVMVCTEGPRLETPAEIEMFRRLGCDVVGMTGFPEVVLARELEMCYASLCYVSNMATGIQERLEAPELSRVSEQIMPQVEKLLIETIGGLHAMGDGACDCGNALRNARFE